MSAGSAEWLAHRDQLKPHHAQHDDRPNLVIPAEGPAPSTAADDVEMMDVEMMDANEMRGAGYGGDGLFRGFPEQAPKGSRRRKRDASTADLPASCPRRSKRIRKPAVNSEFVYD